MTTVQGLFTAAHGQAPVRITTAAEMDEFLDALLKEPFDNSVAALYVEGRLNHHGVPDHELLLAVAAEDGVGGLWYTGPDGESLVAKGATSELDQVVYYYMGSEREFPRDSEVPLSNVRQAAHEFLVSGGELPSSASWARYIG